MTRTDLRLWLPFAQRALTGPDNQLAMEAASLLARYSPRRKVASSWKAEKAKRRSEKNEETAQIRQACILRSGGICECGCGTRQWLGEMDHMISGSGRRLQKQSVENCWMLSRWCHRQKTHNQPSAAYWTEKFNAHAVKYGYPQITRIEHVPVQRRA